MKKILIIVLSLLLIPTIASAQLPPGWPWEWPWDEILATWLGVPKEVVKWPIAFWLILLPYIASVTIIIGIFEEIGILRRATHKGTIYFIIALAWAAFLIPTGFLGSIAVILYTLGAIWAIIIFVVLFFVGGALLLYARLGGEAMKAWTTEMMTTEAKWRTIEKINEKIATLRNQVAEIQSKEKLEPKDKQQIEELQKEIDMLEARKKDLMRT